MNHPVMTCQNGKLHEMCANGAKIDVVDWEECGCGLCTGDIDLQQLVGDDQCLNKDNYVAVMNGKHSTNNPVHWVACECPSCYRYVVEKEAWGCDGCHTICPGAEEAHIRMGQQLCTDCWKKCQALLEKLNINSYGIVGAYREDEISNLWESQVIGTHTRSARRAKAINFEQCECGSCLLRRYNPTLNVTGCPRHAHRDKFADWQKKNKGAAAPFKPKGGCRPF
jgi:hypothetical protein